MHRRTSTLRSPWVVTLPAAIIVVAALAAACSGKVVGLPEGTSSSGSSGASSSGASSGSTGVDPPAYCVKYASCADDNSGLCEASNGEVLTCVGGVWTPRSNPMVEDCVLSAPPEGSSCYSSGAPTQCAYVDGCDSRPSDAPPDQTFVCEYSQWRRTSKAYVATCPASAPNPGDSCVPCAGRYPTTGCAYPTTDGCPPSVASCDPISMTWQVAVPKCSSSDAGAP